MPVATSRPCLQALRLACCVLGLLPGPAPWAQPADPQPAATGARPRVALVLSGGGARGFAHVGVLRALRDLRVPVDLVAGVSMGAVVGGAYAAGRTVQEMEIFVRETDWSDIVSDRPARDHLSFRRREDDLLLPSRIELGLGRAGLSLPLSAAGNAALEAAMHRLLPTGTGDLPVDRLALPFRSVASDLLTGNLVELRDTPLFMSIRASLAVPGVFAPVRLNQQLVVDGGLVRNLPVDIARAMGADIVIAVNVGTPLAGESELDNALGVARQMMNILTEQNVRRSLSELGPADILIAPDLQGVDFLNFHQGGQAMAAGERAARAVAPRLQALSVSDEAYGAFELHRTQAALARNPPLPLARVQVQGTQHADAGALQSLLGLQVGQQITTAQVHGAVNRLLGRGEFERVGVEIVDVDGQRELRIQPVEAEWAHSRLRLGLEVVSDFADDHRFTLNAMHTLAWLNSWGAELRTMARVGSVRGLLTQWWQPLAPGSPWYVAPSLQYVVSATEVYAKQRRSLRMGFRFSTATLAVGRQLGDWGDVQMGVERRHGRTQSLVPADVPGADGRVAETARYAQLQVDTLDSLALPTRGVLLQARHDQGDMGSRSGGHRTSSVVGLSAFRAADWDGHVYGEWSRAASGLAPLSLGGFLRLSGTPRDSVGARSNVLLRLVMARRLGEMPAGLGRSVRAGYSLETGGGYEPADGLRWSGLQQAGSVFVAVDTRFGPAFLALGATRGTGGKVYLFLGPFW